MGTVKYCSQKSRIIYPPHCLNLLRLSLTVNLRLCRWVQSKVLITDFHWSFDGSKLAMVRGHTDSDVVLLQESKQ